MKRTLLVIAIASCLSSCNTFIGIGRDMRIAGEGMEKIASKAAGKPHSDADHSAAPVY